MSYSPEDRAKFVLWFIECPDSHANFDTCVRRELGKMHQCPREIWFLDLKKRNPREKKKLPELI